MVTMLIVDDEDIIREGLRDCINWECMGVRIVGEAENGKKALEKVRELKPDIILTDVVMPGINGIEFIKRVRDEVEDIKIIMLSAYQEVEYMKSAFKYDAIDYILKPFSNDELSQVVCKAIKQLERERNQRKRISEIEYKLHESLPALKEHFFRQLVLGYIHDPKVIIRQLMSYNIYFPDKSSYCAIDVELDIGDSSREVYDTSLDVRALYDVEKLFDNNVHGVVFQYDKHEMCVILSVDYEESQIEYCNVRRFAEKIHCELSGELGVSCTIGVGLVVNNLEDIYRSFRQAREAISQRVLLGKNKIIYYENLQKRPIPKLPVDVLIFQDNILEWLRIGEWNLVVKGIHGFFNSLRNCSISDLRYIFALCTDLLMKVVRRLAVLLNRDDMEYIAVSLDELYFLKDIDEIESFVINQFLKFKRMTKESENRKNSKLIKEVIKILEERYMESLTIKQISGEVYLSPNHMATLFKKQTGETVNDYLTRIRIEKSKEMLNNRSYKIYEVAQKVGYADSKYFSKVFRKHTGMTPGEFREKVL